MSDMYKFFTKSIIKFFYNKGISESIVYGDIKNYTNYSYFQINYISKV
jgi:hypothetical protein